MADVPSLIEEAARRREPDFTAPSKIKNGGVDPLGLRETNFDLMNLLFPGINNVAVHVRPFVVVAWAWRRAGQIVKESGASTFPPEMMRDFVDRVEVIFSWSQFNRDPEVELPGRVVLAPLRQSDSWHFGGDEWKKWRENRAGSTSLMAAITYGPALKNLGWLMPLLENSSIYVPTERVAPALDAFEEQLGDMLNHPAFSEFGAVDVYRSEVDAWAERWAIDRITEAEKRVMAEALFGAIAPEHRQSAGRLMREAVSYSGTTDPGAIRQTMAGHPSNFTPAEDLLVTANLWRSLQLRQLFRFALESLLYWITLEIGNGSRTTDELVRALLDQAGIDGSVASKSLKRWGQTKNAGPVELIDSIQTAINSGEPDRLVVEIFRGLGAIFAEVSADQEVYGRPDRLPVVQACREFASFHDQPTSTFLRHIIESWIFAQHVYWSVGRGLGDARGRGKRLMRLKVILEEGGWTLAPNVSSSSIPRPTADRLRTAISLGTECGYLPAGPI